MPDTVESVESERCSQNDFGRILDRLRKSGDCLQHMRGVESSRSGKIGQKIAVHHCRELGQKVEANAMYSQTLRLTPAIRLAMEEIHVN